MSRSEKIKEEIGWLKATYILLVAIDVSLIGWLFQNWEQITWKLLFLIGGISFLVTLSIVGINHFAYKKIDQLEEL